MTRIKLVSNLLAFAYVSHDATQEISYIVSYYCYRDFFCQKASGVGNESPTIKRHAMLILNPWGLQPKGCEAGVISALLRVRNLPARPLEVAVRDHLRAL
jgi:hypothetical protein